MSDTPLTLHAACGTATGRTVARAIAAVLDSAKPGFVWCEPTPTRTRLENFPSFWQPVTFGDLRKTLTLTKPVALDEARLFWPDGWVHLVARGGDTRWAMFRENAAGTWLPEADFPRAAVETWSEVVAADDLVMLMQDRDLNRYGLARGLFLDATLTARKYTRTGTLIGWTLKVKS